MKRSIRLQFFGWLGLQTVLVFLTIGGVVLAFNLHERHEHPDLKVEEEEEALAVTGVMALLLPAALASAWYISRRLLRPWQRLVLQAERIGGGHIEERIDVAESGDEIGRLAHALNTAFDRYQNLLDRLHRFSFDASHQLRNPLASIRTSGEICLMRERTPADYVSVIGGMLEDTERLSRTVQQLLLLARSAQGALDEQCEEFDLREIVQDVVREARAVGEMRNLSFDTAAPGGPLVVRGVRDLLREALTNLVDNAIRFSPEGGRIEVALEPRPAGHARLSVSDAGPGVEPARRATMFRPFSRGPGSGKESTGLGLVIVADICRAHDGSVGIDGREGGGSRFWMEIPLSPRPWRASVA
jgi:signal transduction histidine kinase